MIEAYVCTLTGWTHQEYEDQPEWLVNQIVMMETAKALARKNPQPET